MKYSTATLLFVVVFAGALSLELHRGYGNSATAKSVGLDADQGAARRVAAAYEADLASALQTHDKAALQRLLVPEFQNTTVNGTLVSRETILNTQVSLVPKEITPQIVVDSVLVRPHVMVVHGHTIYRYQGRIRFTDRFTDVLDRDGDHLRDLGAQETLIERHTPPRVSDSRAALAQRTRSLRD